MAIDHIGVVTVPVRDQEQARAFYVERLGFEVVTDTEFAPGMRWLQVGLPGAETSIVLATGYGTTEDGTDPVGKFTGIVFETDDIAATYTELLGRGVPFTEVPTAQPWGALQAQFTDQDGNGFVLVQRRKDDDK